MSSKAVETFKAESKKIREEKESRKKAKKGGFGKTFVTVSKGSFHTLLLFVFGYFIIFAGTVMTPSILSYILGGLGFTSENASGAEFIVSLMAGFFLTGWIFLVSFICIRGAVKVYIRNLRNLFPDEWLEKIDDLFGKNKDK